MEVEAVLVSTCGRGSHDQSKDAVIYGCIEWVRKSDQATWNHSPMDTAPDVVIDVVLEAARETLADATASARTANILGIHSDHHRSPSGSY